MTRLIAAATPILATPMVAAVTLLTALPSGAQETDPYAMTGGSWITIDGIVRSVRPDAFTLDYGTDTITVEMDDGDRDSDAYVLAPGDEVQVSGLIDDDFFESRSIEAASVYVDGLDTWFHASAVDEEDVLFGLVEHPLRVGRVILQGQVSEVGASGFTLDTGTRSVTVDVRSMAYDPLDDEGYQQIDVGDRVRVTGILDLSFLTGRTVMAESLIGMGS